MARIKEHDLYPRIAAPSELTGEALGLLRLREASRCVVFADWRALQPEESVLDEAAAEDLRERLMRAASLGAEPVLCLYRGEDPEWFAARGGWGKEDNLRCYLRYVGRVARAAGHLCGEYITFWEPNVLVWQKRHNTLARSLTALSHIACTHIRAVRLVRDTREQRGFEGTEVGFVMRLYPRMELQRELLLGRLPVTEALYQRLPMLAMARGEFHLPLRNTLRAQSGVWADFIGVTGAEGSAKIDRVCARARELTGVEPRIMEE